MLPTGGGWLIGPTDPEGGGPQSSVGFLLTAKKRLSVLSKTDKANTDGQALCIVCMVIMKMICCSRQEEYLNGALHKIDLLCSRTSLKIAASLMSLIYFAFSSSVALCL